MTAKKNILVIKLSALGDFVQALGALRAIRQHHKNDHITLLTTKPYENLARQSGYVDDIILDKRPKMVDLPGWLQLRRTFNQGNFDRVYDLQNNDRTGIYFKLFSPKPEWVGTAKGASHRNTSPNRTKNHAFRGHQQTLALAGITDITIDTMDWLDRDLSAFGLQKPYVLIIPGSAPSRPLKRWPAQHYAMLCQYLAEKNYQPVVIGTEAERTEIAEIIAACPEALSLCGKTTLFDLVPLARGADFIIGNDTGPMHMAAPTGTKCLVLFSADSNPTRHLPLGEAVGYLQADNLADLQPETVMKMIEEKFL